MTGFFDIDDAASQRRARRASREQQNRGADLALQALDQVIAHFDDRAQHASRNGLRSMADCFYAAKIDVQMIRREYLPKGGQV